MSATTDAFQDITAGQETTAATHGKVRGVYERFLARQKTHDEVEKRLKDALSFHEQRSRELMRKVVSAKEDLKPVKAARNMFRRLQPLSGKIEKSVRKQTEARNQISGGFSKINTATLSHRRYGKLIADARSAMMEGSSRKALQHLKPQWYHQILAKIFPKGKSAGYIEDLKSAREFVKSNSGVCRQIVAEKNSVAKKQTKVARELRRIINDPESMRLLLGKDFQEVLRRSGPEGRILADAVRNDHGTGRILEDIQKLGKPMDLEAFSGVLKEITRQKGQAIARTRKELEMSEGRAQACHELIQGEKTLRRMEMSDTGMFGSTDVYGKLKEAAENPELSTEAMDEVLEMAGKKEARWASVEEINKVVDRARLRDFSAANINARTISGLAGKSTDWLESLGRAGCDAAKYAVDTVHSITEEPSRALKRAGSRLRESFNNAAGGGIVKKLRALLVPDNGVVSHSPFPSA